VAAGGGPTGSGGEVSPDQALQCRVSRPLILGQTTLQKPRVVENLESSSVGERQQSIPAAESGAAVVDFDAGVGQEFGKNDRLAPANLVQGTETIRLRPAVPIPGDRVTNEIETAHPDLGSIRRAE
jgi:hypothetical protein